MAKQNIEKFDLKIVQHNFLQALIEDDDINLKIYLDSYEELNKFFNLMGTVFGFVSKDLKSKMDILAELLAQKTNATNYETVKKMVRYEKENNLLEKEDYVSGCRTLLRLHRGLNFINAFLKGVNELQDDDHTAAVCRKAYDQTLAHHHSFIIRNGAKIAMYTLPSRGQLLQRVCGEEDDIKKAVEILPKTLDVATIVYERIESIYVEHDLLDLP